MISIFCDNAGVVHSCFRAASESPEFNQMVARLWIKAAAKKLGIVIFQVESEANPADEPSRECYDFVHRHNAIYTEPVLPLWGYHLWDCRDMTPWTK